MVTVPEAETDEASFTTRSWTPGELAHAAATFQASTPPSDHCFHNINAHLSSCCFRLFKIESIGEELSGSGLSLGARAPPRNISYMHTHTQNPAAPFT